MPPKAIPDRWIPYNPCGKVIEGTRFICFKVPLKRSVQNNNQEIKKIWDIPAVLADIPKLGAVIDLTNTARYYNPMDFTKANVLHRKILMPGRMIPPESSVKEFMDAADEFLAKNTDSLVGVHCTHGLNRTGYMVCRYMRDKLGIPAQEAIKRFEAARGYKMERDIYINGILGTTNTPDNVGRETEVIPVSEPVQNRRNDVTYRSPLADYRDDPPSEDYSRRFGNSGPNNDRYGNSRYYYNSRYGKNQNSSRSTNSNTGLFSCYTNRYNNEQNSSSSGRRDRDIRSNGSTQSWRKREQSSGSSQRYRSDDNRYRKERRDDGSRTRDH